MNLGDLGDGVEIESPGLDGEVIDDHFESSNFVGMDVVFHNCCSSFVHPPY